MMNTRSERLAMPPASRVEQEGSNVADPIIAAVNNRRINNLLTEMIQDTQKGLED